MMAKLLIEETMTERTRTVRRRYLVRPSRPPVAATVDVDGEETTGIKPVLAKTTRAANVLPFLPEHRARRAG